MRPASRPRQSTRSARPGLTGEDGNAHAPSANPSRYRQRDPPVMTTCTHARCRNVRKPVPVRYPRGRVRHSRWTPPSDSLPDTACPVASGRTPSTPPGTPSPNRKRRGQRTDERHGRHSDIPDRNDHEDSLPGRRTPSSRAGVAAWQPRSARRWQQGQRNRDHLGYGQGSCLVLLHSSSRASAHCSPRTITGRA
jgi:hypothetical protein